jgi:hypothetical protein
MTSFSKLYPYYTRITNFKPDRIIFEFLIYNYDMNCDSKDYSAQTLIKVLD